MRAAAVLVALVGLAQDGIVPSYPKPDYEVKEKDDYPTKKSYPTYTKKSPYPPKETDYDDEDCDDDYEHDPKYTSTDKHPYPPKYTPTKKYDPKYTTKTYTKTYTYTITSCPYDKKDCGYDKHPYTTVTKEAYTTVCPVEETDYPEYPAKDPEYPAKYPAKDPEYPAKYPAKDPEYPAKSYSS
jgi:hypothetical protein